MGPKSKRKHHLTMSKPFCLHATVTIGGTYLVKVITPQDYRDSAFSATFHARADTMQAARAECLTWAKRRNMVQCTPEEIEALSRIEIK